VNLSPDDLAREVAATGFPRDALRKVFRLLSLLDGLNTHPFLKGRLALKGGTALNLFLYDVPRLSVDIDLNYLGEPEREAMLSDRPNIERAVKAVCSREDLQIRRLPVDHAGGKWRLSYADAAGGTGNLEMDLNFMLRTPIWPPVHLDSHAIGSRKAAPVLVLDPHELAAGKLAALMARGAGRDIFDAQKLLSDERLDPERLRLGFVIYGAINRRDWRTVSVMDVTGDPREFERSLIPMLRRDQAPGRDQIDDWTCRLTEEVRELLGGLLPFAPNEMEFLDRINGHGEIDPDLLTDDEPLRSTLRGHPALRWKARNVRKHRGLPER